MGSAEPLAALYDEHGSRLYRYALLLLASREAAEDAVQDVFVRVAKLLTRRHPPDVTFSYLAAAVRNECFSLLRRRKRRPEAQPPILEAAASDASEEERLIVDAALRVLPMEQREVVYLKAFEGLTFAEIGERCGISLNTAASRYRYAVEAMRRLLAGSTMR